MHSKAYSSFLWPFILMIVVSLGCGTSQVSYQPPLIPISVSVDTDGNIDLSASASLGTPIGTFTLSNSQTVVSLREISDKRLLIIRLDQVATVYNLEEGKEFKVEFNDDNTLYEQVNLTYETDGDIVLELESVEAGMNAGSGNETTGGNQNNPSESNQAQPTEIGIYNPSGTIDAGIPIYVDDFMLSVDASSIDARANFIRVILHVKNVGDEKRLFRFTPGSVTLTDDIGTIYAPVLSKNMSFGDCYQTDLSISKQVDILPNETVDFASDYWLDDGNWCKFDIPDFVNNLPTYAGTISINAQYVIIQFEGFGPFSNFSIRIRL